VVSVPSALKPAPEPHRNGIPKIKALIRTAAARSCDALWQAAGHVCGLFTAEECCKFFKAAGYEAD